MCFTITELDDAIVLITDNPENLQCLLNVFNWCVDNKMTIIDKSKIVPFRNPSASRSDFVFRCGNSVIEYAFQYTYLGLVLTEYLDYAVTAKCVATSGH